MPTSLKQPNAVLASSLYGLVGGLAVGALTNSTKGLATAAVTVPVVTNMIGVTAASNQNEESVSEATKQGALTGTTAGALMGVGVASLGILASSLNDRPSDAQNDTLGYPKAYLKFYDMSPAKKVLASAGIITASTAAGAIIGSIIGATQGAITGNPKPTVDD